MTRLTLLLCSAALFACSPEAGERDAPPAPAAASADATPTHTGLGDSGADLDSDVAPYVMARGAGPSRISPDGRWIATQLSLTGTRQVYVMDAAAQDPQATLQQVTNGAGVTFFAFSPSGALLYGADNDGDERENYWVVAPEGEEWGEPRLLLPATDNGFRVFGGFSGDGAMAVFSSTEAGGDDFDIYRLDMDTGETTMVHEGEGGLYVQAVSPDGATAILSEAVGEDADRLYALDLETGTRRVLSDPTPRANHTDAGVVFAGDDTAIFASNTGQEFASLRSVQVSGGMALVAGLMEEGDADVDAVEVCGTNRVATINRDGFSSAFLVSGTGRVRALGGLPRGVYGIDCAGDQLLIRVSAPNIPGDLYLANLDSGAVRRVFASNYDGLDPESLVMPESVRLPARDGVEVQGLLYRPEGVEKPPVVFMVHGGPTAQARPTYNSTAQYLLSKGIAVFQTNVRGSTGFGRTYTTLDDQEKRTDSVRDLVDMLDYLEADGRVDTSRAAVMGGSYGGYMVNAVLSEYPDAFDAGVALFGVGDWVAALEVASPQLKASDVVEYGDIGDPAVRDFHASISPVAKADRIRVPVLYSHGAMDPRIDKAETEIMVRALRENSVRADYVLFPDEGHGWRKLDNRLFYERVQAEFLEEVLGD